MNERPSLTPLQRLRQRTREALDDARLDLQQLPEERERELSTRTNHGWRVDKLPRDYEQRRERLTRQIAEMEADLAWLDQFGQS